MKYLVYKGKELVGETILLPNSNVYHTHFFKELRLTMYYSYEDFKRKRLTLVPNEEVSDD